jgi:hypothetical protein
LLLERNPGCVPEPRAVALDGESLRTLQAVGLAETVLADIHQGFIADYVSGDGTELFRTDMRHRPYGLCLQNSFDQPRLERQLLESARRFDCVSIRHSTELLEFSQDDSGVYCSLRSAGSQPQPCQGRYLVACDGGKSGIRHSLSIEMSGGGGPMLPQPASSPECEALLATHLGDSFSALLPPKSALPDALRTHPLWEQLKPTVVALPAAYWDGESGLRSRLGIDGKSLLLLRPDRFLLAVVDLDADPDAALDKLQNALRPGT